MSETSRDQLRALVAAKPDLTVRDAVAELGISRQRLHQLTKSEGISLRDARRTIFPPSESAETTQRHVAPTVTLKAAGGISEILVAVDALRRGYDVYRSVTIGGLCDLVAVNRQTGTTVRIEVKSAQRSARGKPTHGSVSNNKFDVLALVFPDGAILYTPDAL